MANRIKISVIGASGPAEDRGNGQGAVDHLIDYWRQQFDQVLPDGPDLIVVPECCDQYPRHAQEVVCREYCATRQDQVLEFFRQTAREARCYLTHPALREAEDDGWYNSVQLIDRSGQVIGAYDKNFPTLGELDAGVRPGAEAVAFSTEFGRVAAVICFDLNFDALRQQVQQLKPDLILFCSMYHGGLMQAYWAYFCRVHLASAVTGLPSHIICPSGEVLASTTNYQDFVTATVNLDCRLVHFDNHWDKLAQLKRRYGSQVTIGDPGLLGSVRVTCEAEDRTVMQVLEEFEIELLDDYLKRSQDRVRELRF